MKAHEYKRLEADLPLIRGHAGPVVDFDFSPFNDSLLATASEDGTVKMWCIPEEGITKDVTECDAELRGHSKKLIFSKFHPSADYTIATSGLDTTVRIWDISQQKCAVTFEDLKSTTNGLEWSHNGSLLGCITKDKNLSFFDPRKDTSCVSVATHEGARPQKLTWLGDSEHILTCGFSRLSEREYAVWDIRNFGAPLIKKRLDDYSGVPFLYFDEEQKVVYVAGKGESAISFFQYSSESTNFIDYLGSFKGREPQKGFSFMPKKVLDLMSNEVNRGVRLTAKTVEYVSFKVPRKSGTFQADLFPPCKSQEPAMKFDDYISGQNVDPIRVELRPDVKADAVSAQKKANFMSKIGAQDTSSASTAAVVSQAPSRSQADQDEIDALRRKVEDLAEDLSQAKQTISQLQNEVESLTQTNENLVYNNQHLKGELEQAQDQINALNNQIATAAQSQAAYTDYSQHDQQQHQQYVDDGNNDQPYDFNHQQQHHDQQHDQQHEQHHDGAHHEEHHQYQ